MKPELIDLIELIEDYEPDKKHDPSQLKSLLATSSIIQDLNNDAVASFEVLYLLVTKRLTGNAREFYEMSTILKDIKNLYNREVKEAVDKTKGTNTETAETKYNLGVAISFELFKSILTSKAHTLSNNFWEDNQLKDSITKIAPVERFEILSRAIGGRNYQLAAKIWQGAALTQEFFLTSDKNELIRLLTNLKKYYVGTGHDFKAIHNILTGLNKLIETRPDKEEIQTLSTPSKESSTDKIQTPSNPSTKKEIYAQSKTRKKKNVSYMKVDKFTERNKKWIKLLKDWQEAKITVSSSSESSSVRSQINVVPSVNVSGNYPNITPRVHSYPYPSSYNLTIPYSPYYFSGGVTSQVNTREFSKRALDALLNPSLHPGFFSTPHPFITQPSVTPVPTQPQTPTQDKIIEEVVEAEGTVMPLKVSKAAVETHTELDKKAESLLSISNEKQHAPLQFSALLQGEQQKNKRKKTNEELDSDDSSYDESDYDDSDDKGYTSSRKSSKKS